MLKHEEESREAEERLQASQESTLKALSSLQEAQERMAAELSRIKATLEQPPEHKPAEKQAQATKPNPTAAQAASATVAPMNPVTQEHVQSWNVARPRRKRKVITGTSGDGTEGRFLGAPQVGSIFVFHVEKSTEEADVQDWLQEKKKVEAVSVRQMSHPDSTFKSFKVTLPKDELNRVLQDDFGWPENVKIRRFAPSRRNARP